MSVLGTALSIGVRMGECSLVDGDEVGGFVFPFVLSLAAGALVLLFLALGLALGRDRRAAIGMRTLFLLVCDGLLTGCCEEHEHPLGSTAVFGGQFVFSQRRNIGMDVMFNIPSAEASTYPKILGPG